MLPPTSCLQTRLALAKILVSSMGVSFNFIDKQQKVHLVYIQQNDACNKYTQNILQIKAEQRTTLKKRSTS